MYGDYSREQSGQTLTHWLIQIQQEVPLHRRRIPNGPSAVDDIPRHANVEHRVKEDSLSVGSYGENKRRSHGQKSETKHGKNPLRMAMFG